MSNPLFLLNNTTFATAEFGQKVKHLANQGSGPAQTLQHRIHKDTVVRQTQEFYTQDDL